jgi:imidazolonepropionase-like amidohydrolase
MRLILGLLFFASVLRAQTTYLHCGHLLPIHAEAMRNVTVVVEGDKIARIERGFLPAPAGVQLVDLKNHSVLPGLIDCHVHIESEQSPRSYTERLTLNDADIAYRAATYAQRTLEAGFTTVRDLGGTGVNIALRNAINAGWATGPRIITVGHSLSVTGGHGDHTTGRRWDLFDQPGPEIGIADGPDECRAAVREQIKRGADCIKVNATGGVLSLARDGRLPHYAEDELQAIVATARDLGVDVAAHAHGDEGMRRAVEAGVVTIEHGTFMSEATMEAMIRRGTWYVPTLTAGHAVSDSARNAPGFFPDVVRKKAREIGPTILATATKAYQKGVKIAFGTDAGVYPHGKNRLEFLYMAQMGMKNAEILRSATLDAATLLHLDDKIGSLQAGKLADIVAVRGNPLEDIKAMLELAFVMKEGKIIVQK